MQKWEKGIKNGTFQMSIVTSYWLPSTEETGEMAAPMAILLFVWTNPEHNKL